MKYIDRNERVWILDFTVWILLSDSVCASFPASTETNFAAFDRRIIALTDYPRTSPTRRRSFFLNLIGDHVLPLGVPVPIVHLLSLVFSISFRSFEFGTNCCFLLLFFFFFFFFVLFLAGGSFSWEV